MSLNEGEPVGLMTGLQAGAFLGFESVPSRVAGADETKLAANFD